MSRWLEQTGGTRGEAYAETFRKLAASGVDVHGEAAYVAALVQPGARVLDAGCGTGRVGAELAVRGYEVVGVDSDASMLAMAPVVTGALWRQQDLVSFDEPAGYDLIVAAGNVMVYLADGTGPEVVARLARALRPGALLVSGWRTDQAEADGRPVLAVSTYDQWTAAAGLSPVARHSTWQGAALAPDSGWCVSVDRAPGTV